MRADELSAPAGQTFKFDNPGDTIEGVVAYIGDWNHRTNKFGKEETVTKIGINTGNGELSYIYPAKGSSMASAIADALRTANLPELLEGQTLELRYDDDKDVGKGNPMKVFRAKITPGEKPAVPDEEPF